MRWPNPLLWQKRYGEATGLLLLLLLPTALLLLPAL
jgi:hypothetical protein